MPRPLQVFLCHASQDKPEVWKLHRYLKTRGVKPWLDVEDLLPGEDWEVEIPKALFASDIILVCLSKNSVNKEGYVQKEIVFALDKALEKPEGTIFIIPVKLEDCELPKRLSRYQAVDLFRTDGRKRLLMGLNKRIANLGDEVLPIKIDETKQRTPKPIKPEPKLEEKPQKNTRHELEREKIKKVVSDAQIITDKYIKHGIEEFEEDKKRRKPLPLAKQKFNNKVVLFGGILLILVAGFLFAGNYILNNLPASETPEITSTEEIINTSTFAPTATATKSLAISTTTRLGIGSTTLGSDGMLLMYVPAGEFTMGSNDGGTDERPIHQVYLDAYWIDQTEVTNEQYILCVNIGRCKEPGVAELFLNSGYANHPVVYISWEDAKTYCEWAGRRLPTEAEWEKAARGPDGNVYPWGNNAPASDLLNYNNEIGETTEVGNYPNGASIYGTFDMSGNVWEWVSSLYQPYPYDADDGREYLATTVSRVMRGGSWLSGNSGVHSALRSNYPPTSTGSLIGFRCAMDAN